jgi:hypothetical protein
VKEKVVVARIPGTQKYACSEKNLGWDVIGSTTNVWSAIHAISAAGLMSRLGGHYSSYEAVEVELERISTIGQIVPFPPESEVWDED